MHKWWRWNWRFLEPLQIAPVIIEDNTFIGSRCIVVEGVRVEKEVVLGANVVLTASTKIIDVGGNEPIEYKGYVPSRSVVIPGTCKIFPCRRLPSTLCFNYW